MSALSNDPSPPFPSPPQAGLLPPGRSARASLPSPRSMDTIEAELADLKRSDDRR